MLISALQSCWVAHTVHATHTQALQQALQSVCRLLERVRELEGSEARVKELEADALLRTMEAPLDYPEEEESFCSSSDHGAYEPNFDRDWVSLATPDAIQYACDALVLHSS